MLFRATSPLCAGTCASVAAPYPRQNLSHARDREKEEKGKGKGERQAVVAAVGKALIKKIHFTSFTQ